MKANDVVRVRILKQTGEDSMYRWSLLVVWSLLSALSWGLTKARKCLAMTLPEHRTLGRFLGRKVGLRSPRQGRWQRLGAGLVGGAVVVSCAGEVPSRTRSDNRVRR
jgi:hypothetical protein